MGSTFSLCLSSAFEKGSFLLSVGCCEKSRLWGVQILQCCRSDVYAYKHHGLEGGDGGAISDIFWSTWHIFLWSPEERVSGKILLCSVSGSNWLYQKHRIIVGITEQPFSWGHLSQRHSPWHHTQIPVLSLTQPDPLWFWHLFYFYPLNSPTVFLSRWCVDVSMGDVCFLVFWKISFCYLCPFTLSTAKEIQFPREDVCLTAVRYLLL